MSPSVHIFVPPAKKENLSWGDAKTSPPCHKYGKKLNVFYINIITRQQFIISVSETTKNMLKQRFPVASLGMVTPGADPYGFTSLAKAINYSTLKAGGQWRA